jgi:hypothetical protein
MPRSLRLAPPRLKRSTLPGPALCGPPLSTPLLSSKSRRIVRADPPRERRLMGGFDFRLRVGDADCNGASKLAAPRLFDLRPDKLLRSLIRAAPFG